MTPGQTHKADDTIIAAAESLLRERAATLLTLATNYPDGSPERKRMVTVSALCTAAASVVESALGELTALEIPTGPRAA